MPGLYFTVNQVIELMQFFPKEVYLRIQLIQAVFSHILDLENFDLIFDQVLDDDERREVSGKISLSFQGLTS